MWVKCVSKNVWRDFRHPVSVFATVALKSSNCKFSAKIHFPIAHFMLPLLAVTDIESLKSLRTLFGPHADEI